MIWSQMRAGDCSCGWPGEATDERYVAARFTRATSQRGSIQTDFLSLLGVLPDVAGTQEVPAQQFSVRKSSNAFIAG